jgi:hypothetical protein
MNWQDLVVAIGSWIFVVSFIPSFIKKEYPAVSTSIITGVILLVFSSAYFTLSLPLAAISNMVTSFCWFAMAVLRIRSKQGR